MSCLRTHMRLKSGSALNVNWLQVFKRAHTALLGSGGGPEQRTSLVPSEKCAVRWGSDDDEMRMITASFVRAIERFSGDPCRHFLPLFQQVVAIRKTCNQLIPYVGLLVVCTVPPLRHTSFPPPDDAQSTESGCVTQVVEQFLRIF